MTDTLHDRPVDAAVANCRNVLTTAAAAVDHVAATAPEWCRPYLYGVPGHPAGEPRALRIGIECPTRAHLVAVGDAFYMAEPWWRDLPTGASVTIPLDGATVVAYWADANTGAGV